MFNGSIDEPLDYGGRYWGSPGRLFHKDTLFSPVRYYMYLRQQSRVKDTLQVLKLELFRDDIVEYTLNSHLYKHKNWKLFYTNGFAHDSALMHRVIQTVTGFFKNMEYSDENVEKIQQLLLSKTNTLVSPQLVKEMCKLYRLI